MTSQPAYKLSMLLPAICRTCNTGFQFTVDIPVPQETDQILIQGCSKSRSCPSCRGDGRVPDGTYKLEEGETRFAYGPSESLKDLRRLESLLKRPIISKKRIVKFCDHKYHLTKTKFIQLGTLEYYRKSDNCFIKDSTEGIYSRAVEDKDWRNKPHSAEAINAFVGSNFLNGPGKITARKIVIPKQFPNIYLFCTSRLENPDLEIAKQFGAYDSFYEITDPYEFAEIIRKQLEMELGNIVVSIIGEVRYDDEKVKIFETLEAGAA